MKRVLSIQDLSCMGKCSLSVALPVLSAMGCSCTVLPTAVLSTHTAFPNPHIRDLTQDLWPVAEHWHSVGAAFDAIAVGYLSDPRQAELVGRVLDLFPSRVILDPAMGDHGKLYSGLGEDHVSAMASLCRKADFLLPNVTEAALLTGLPYREDADTAYLRALAQGMLTFGAETVIITGFTRPDGQTGFFGMHQSGEAFSYRAQRIGKHFHGTGDLFAAAFTGALMTQKTAPEAATLAARFTERVIAATEESTPFGIAFEPELGWLLEQL